MLPRFLQVLLIAFGLIPVWSAVTLGAPWTLFATGVTPAASVALVAYWVGPLALCLSILLRSHVVVFVFMVECVALLVDAALATAGSAAPLLGLTRLVLVSGVAVLGVAFVYRDVSMPFFSGKQRGFRRAARLRANVRLQVKGRERGVETVAELEDCSLVGMSFAMPATGTERPLQKGEAVDVTVRLDRGSVPVAGLVAWCVRDDLFFRAGLSTTDVTAMGRVIEGVGMRAVPPATAGAMRLLAKTSVSRAALAAWLVAFGGSAAMPACGTDSGFSGSGSKTASKKPGKKVATEAGGDEVEDTDSGKGSGKGSGKASDKGSGNDLVAPERDGDTQKVVPDEESQEKPPSDDEMDVLTVEIENDVTAAVDAACATDPAATPLPAVGDKAGKAGKDGKGSSATKAQKPKSVFIPKGEPLPRTVPDDCREGIEMNRPTRKLLAMPTTNGATGNVPLEVDIATYLAPDHIRLLAVDAAGKKTVILDTCRLQTWSAGDPTNGSVQRPLEDSIREFRTSAPSGTTALEFDFTDAGSPTYIRVLGLCDFAPAQTRGASQVIGLVDREGNPSGVVQSTP